MTFAKISKLNELCSDGIIKTIALGQKSGQVLASASEDKKINLWAIGKPHCIIKLEADEIDSTAINALRFGHSDELLISGHENGLVHVWNLQSLNVIRTFEGCKDNAIKSLDITSNATLLASGSCNGIININDMRSASCIAQLKHYDKALGCIRFSPDNKWLATGSDDSSIKIWDLGTRKIICEFRDHVQPITRLEFHPTHFVMASSSRDRTIKLWDLDTFKIISTSPPEKHAYSAISYNVTGEVLAASHSMGLTFFNAEPLGIIEDVKDDWKNVMEMVSTSQLKFIAASFVGKTVSTYAINLKPFTVPSIGDSTGNLNESRLQMSSSSRFLNTTSSNMYPSLKRISTSKSSNVTSPIALKLNRLNRGLKMANAKANPTTNQSTLHVNAIDKSSEKRRELLKYRRSMSHLQNLAQESSHQIYKNDNGPDYSIGTHNGFLDNNTRHPPGFNGGRERKYSTNDLFFHPHQPINGNTTNFNSNHANLLSTLPIASSSPRHNLTNSESVPFLFNNNNNNLNGSNNTTDLEEKIRRLSNIVKKGKDVLRQSNTGLDKISPTSPTNKYLTNSRTSNIFRRDANRLPGALSVNNLSAINSLGLLENSVNYPHDERHRAVGMVSKAKQLEASSSCSRTQNQARISNVTQMKLLGSQRNIAVHPTILKGMSNSYSIHNLSSFAASKAGVAPSNYNRYSNNVTSRIIQNNPLNCNKFSKLNGTSKERVPYATSDKRRHHSFKEPAVVTIASTIPQISKGNEQFITNTLPTTTTYPSSNNLTLSNNKSHLRPLKVNHNASLMSTCKSKNASPPSLISEDANANLDFNNEPIRNKPVGNEELISRLAITNGDAASEHLIFQPVRTELSRTPPPTLSLPSSCTTETNWLTTSISSAGQNNYPTPHMVQSTLCHHNPLLQLDVCKSPSSYTTSFFNGPGAFTSSLSTTKPVVMIRPSSNVNLLKHHPHPQNASLEMMELSQYPPPPSDGVYHQFETVESSSAFHGDIQSRHRVQNDSHSVYGGSSGYGEVSCLPINNLNNNITLREYHTVIAGSERPYSYYQPVVDTQSRDRFRETPRDWRRHSDFYDPYSTANQDNGNSRSLMRIDELGSYNQQDVQLEHNYNQVGGPPSNHRRRVNDPSHHFVVSHHNDGDDASASYRRHQCNINNNENVINLSPGNSESPEEGNEEKYNHCDANSSSMMMRNMSSSTSHYHKPYQNERSIHSRKPVMQPHAFDFNNVNGNNNGLWIDSESFDTVLSNSITEKDNLPHHHHRDNDKCVSARFINQNRSKTRQSCSAKYLGAPRSDACLRRSEAFESSSPLHNHNKRKVPRPFGTTEDNRFSYFENRSPPNKSLMSGSTHLLNMPPQNYKNTDKNVNNDSILTEISSSKKGTSDPLETSENITSTHLQICDIFATRIRHLRMAKNLCRNNADLKTAISTILDMNEESVLYDVINLFLNYPHLWTLDIGLVLLPHTSAMLNHKYETYTSLGCRILRVILKNFGPLIKATINRTPGLGVDLSREERLRKCNVCHKQLVSLKPFFTSSITYGGKLGKEMKDVQILLSQTLD